MKRVTRLALSVLILASLLVQMSGCGLFGGKTGDGEMDISGVCVTIPYSEGLRAVVEMEAADTLSRYIIARSYLEMLDNFDVSDEATFDAEAYQALFDQTLEAFEIAQLMSDDLEDNAALLEEKMNQGYTGYSGSVTYQEYAPYTSDPSLRRSASNPFILQASAAEDSEALKWAKELTDAYDKAPAGKGLRTLAAQLGTDAKRAYALLKQAQAIIEGDAYGAEASAANDAYKLAVSTKAVASTAGFVVSVVATGGATGVAAAIGTAGAAVNGANAILDVGAAGTIVYTNGEGNEYTAMFDQTSKDFSHVTFVVGLLGAGAGVNDATKAETAANIINSTLFFFGQADYIADNLSDMTAMTVQSGTGGLKVFTEKGKFEKTTEGLKTAGQMLLNAGFPGLMAADAVAQAAKDLGLQNAVADAVSPASAANQQPDAPSGAGDPSQANTDPSGTPDDPSSGSEATPDTPAQSDTPTSGSSSTGGNPFETEPGGFSGDPEKVAQEWSGPKEKEDDFDIQDYLDKLRQVLEEIAAMADETEETEETEMTEETEETEETETIEENPLSAENVAGTYALSGMQHTTGLVTISGGGTEAPYSMTLTVTASGETTLTLNFTYEKGTEEVVVGYDPETGETDSFMLKAFTAGLTFYAESGGVTATLLCEWSSDYGTASIDVSGVKGN